MNDSHDQPLEIRFSSVSVRTLASLSSTIATVCRGHECSLTVPAQALNRRSYER